MAATSGVGTRLLVTMYKVEMDHLCMYVYKWATCMCMYACTCCARARVCVCVCVCVCTGSVITLLSCTFVSTGNLALSRAIGDFGYKVREKDPKLQVISGQYITCV